MNVAVRQGMTLPEFLAWEERQELRYEFDGFAPIAMTGGTYEHDGISMNLAAALVNRLRG
ncbi:MAG: Uma2 family endonuclease, partial [Planctomycetes bacterium]|nr:Uma2 family endonuclease [Planctomycetota bacterium]